MVSVHKKCPVDYGLCNQTVTVYHKDGDNIMRTVYDRAFLEYKKGLNVDKTGSHEATSFLLVIPGPVQAVFVGDKVLHGAGREIATVDEWRRFIPANVPGLCVAQYVDLKFWDGKIIHTEASG